MRPVAGKPTCLPSRSFPASTKAAAATRSLRQPLFTGLRRFSGQRQGRVTDYLISGIFGHGFRGRRRRMLLLSSARQPAGCRRHKPAFCPLGQGSFYAPRTEGTASGSQVDELHGGGALRAAGRGVDAVGAMLESPWAPVPLLPKQAMRRWRLAPRRCCARAGFWPAAAPSGGPVMRKCHGFSAAAPSSPRSSLALARLRNTIGICRGLLP